MKSDKMRAALMRSFVLAVTLLGLFQGAVVSVWAQTEKEKTKQLPGGCADGQVAKWDELQQLWVCADDQETDITELQQQVNDNTTAIQTNAEDIGTNATKIAANTVSIDANSSEISGLKDRVSTNEGNITNLQDRVTTNEADIEDLDNRVTDLEGAIGNPDPPCFDNGNRYADCGNGTVTDTVTGLTWLREANCFLVEVDWAAANEAASQLADGECGLTDGSKPGDWRLASAGEWLDTIDAALAHFPTCLNPTLTDVAGDSCHANDPAFTGVQNSGYWTSTAQRPPSAIFQATASAVGLGLGLFGQENRNNLHFVWPVRAR